MFWKPNKALPCRIVPVLPKFSFVFVFVHKVQKGPYNSRLSIFIYFHLSWSLVGVLAGSSEKQMPRWSRKWERFIGVSPCGRKQGEEAGEGKENQPSNTHTGLTPVKEMEKKERLGRKSLLRVQEDCSWKNPSQVWW